jgi:signal transduction histidine kinase
MRLALILTAAISVALAIVLGLALSFQIQRESRLFETDTTTDNLLMGAWLAEAAGETWKTHGEPEARAFIERADSRRSHVRVHWVEKDPTTSRDLPSARIDPSGEGRVICRVPVLVDGQVRASIELVETLAAQRAYVHASIVRDLFTTLALVAVVSGVAMLVGWRFIGRPVHALATKLERAARGDFANPVQVPRRGELTRLADELNRTCDSLAAYQSRLREETSQRVRAAEQLRHADRLRTVGQIASGLAHELGTPLSVIQTRTRMIQAGDVAAEAVASQAAMIGAQAERITTLVRRMLDFARMRNLDRVSVDLAQTVAHSIELLEPYARQRGVRLEAKRPDLPVRAYVDAGLLQQVISNCVMNSIQAVSGAPAEGPGWVLVHTESPEPRGGQARSGVIRIEDNGPGIDAAINADLFEPFVTTKPPGEGTGLGLSIARQIVEEHGGTIEHRPREGGGAVFLITIPLEAGDARTSAGR